MGARVPRRRGARLRVRTRARVRARAGGGGAPGNGGRVGGSGGRRPGLGGPAEGTRLRRRCGPGRRPLARRRGRGPRARGPVHPRGAPARIPLLRRVQRDAGAALGAACVRGRRVPRAGRTQRPLPHPAGRDRARRFHAGRVRSAQGFAGGGGGRPHPGGVRVLEPEPGALRRVRHRLQAPGRGRTRRAVRRAADPQPSPRRHPELQRSVPGLHLVLLPARVAVAAREIEAADPAPRRARDQPSRVRSARPASLHRRAPGPHPPGGLLDALPVPAGPETSRSRSHGGRPRRRWQPGERSAVRSLERHAAPPRGRARAAPGPLAGRGERGTARQGAIGPHLPPGRERAPRVARPRVPGPPLAHRSGGRAGRALRVRRPGGRRRGTHGGAVRRAGARRHRRGLPHRKKAAREPGSHPGRRLRSGAARDRRGLRGGRARAGARRHRLHPGRRAAGPG